MIPAGTCEAVDARNPDDDSANELRCNVVIWASVPSMIGNKPTSITRKTT